MDDLDTLLKTAQAQILVLPRSPENRATFIALADARAWQAARRAVEATAGGSPGLGWEEI